LIQAFPGPSPFCTLHRESLRVFIIGCPQVLQSKDYNHCISVSMYDLQDCLPQCRRSCQQRRMNTNRHTLEQPWYTSSIGSH
jgi:sulfur relay (sulfurtransferase) DsrF/TusC family protein